MESDGVKTVIMDKKYQKANNDLPSDKEIWLTISRARHAQYKTRQKELAPYNVTPMQSYILSIIKELGDEATPKKIAKVAFRDAPTISTQLQKMEKKGLLKKVRDFPAKNLFRVLLTEKGWEIYNHVLEAKTIHNIISILSDEERRQTKSIMEKLFVKAIKEMKKYEDRPEYYQLFNDSSE